MSDKPQKNVDLRVVADFGAEWNAFDQRDLPEAERADLFAQYFSVFPWKELRTGAEGFDAGCGSGRWASLVAPQVGHLHCVDPSTAIDVARQNLRGFDNCSFHRASVEDMPMPDGGMDFGYSLGVLHHVPDTLEGLKSCVQKLRPGAPFLVYLYYSFDNRPLWYRWLWTASDAVRRLSSRLPAQTKRALALLIAFAVYLPLARFARLLEACGLSYESFPLSAYRRRSFYTMTTDALDRFGTRLEQRFSRAEMHSMMSEAGLERIRFREGEPYWCAVGFKRLGGR